MLQVIRSFLALAIPIALIAIHCAVMLCFINRWDSVVTVTLIPIWIWGVAGIFIACLAWIFLKSRLSAFVMVIWLVTAVVCADETPGLLRGVQNLMLPGDALEPAEPAEASRLLGVVTLNCDQKTNPDAAAKALVERLQAEGDASEAPIDVVFLQEAPDQKVLEEIRKQLFGGQGDSLSRNGCAIIARGKLNEIDLDLDTLAKVPGTQVAATLEIEPGVEVELVNVHLKRSVLRYDLWNLEAWQANTEVRRHNRTRLREILGALPQRAIPRPRVIGGDFGTPYNDDLYRVLKRGYQDAFRRTGSGWGNTYPADYPLLRIDQLWSSNDLEPLVAGAESIDSSDHRLVRAYFRLNKPSGFLALR